MVMSLKPRNVLFRRSRAVNRGRYIRSAVLIVALASVHCSENPISSTGTSVTGTPATISLTSTIVSTTNPPTASIVATVRDAGEYLVSRVAVTFTTTAGFVTSGGTTGPDGVTIAILTGIPGTSPTVTATATSGTQTVSRSIVVHF
jgi:hypothetical protein